MVKYVYNVEQEVFRRVDNRGPPLKVNIIEARRIRGFMDLGTKAPTIHKKIDWVNPISMTTLRTVMKNIEEGNLELDGDYPAPIGQIHDMDVEARLNKLEMDVDELKRTNHQCICDDNGPGFSDKVKKWLKM